MSETKMTIGKNGALTFEDISQSLSKITEQHKAIGRIETPKGLIKKTNGNMGIIKKTILSLYQKLVKSVKLLKCKVCGLLCQCDQCECIATK